MAISGNCPRSHIEQVRLGFFVADSAGFSLRSFCATPEAFGTERLNPNAGQRTFIPLNSRHPLLVVVEHFRLVRVSTGDKMSLKTR